MSTVQLAMNNQRYAALLAEVLEKDGVHNVVFTDQPDLGLEGVIVVDGDRPDNLVLFEAQPERFVVITRKDAGLLARIWEAGVRHVVFEEDSLSTAQLAVSAAELRLPQTGGAVLPALSRSKKLVPKFPIPILNEHRGCHYLKARTLL